MMTKEGDSKLAFGYERNKPIFGSWQGATKSVISWTLISSMLQKIHQREVQGAIFMTPNRKSKVEQSTLGFLDDNNNCVTGREGTMI